VFIGTFLNPTFHLGEINGQNRAPDHLLILLHEVSTQLSLLLTFEAYNMPSLFYLGPFKGLDAEVIKAQVDEAWKVLFKLAKTFHDVPGSKRVAEMARAKVEKLKQFVPVLQTVCNPGLQDRHWVQVGTFV